MQEFIARENIKRFKQLLESCKDQRQRTTLEKFLADEEEHLIRLGAGVRCLTKRAAGRVR